MLKYIIVVAAIAALFYCYSNGMFSGVEQRVNNVKNATQKEQLIQDNNTGVNVVRYKSFADVLNGK